MKAMEYLYAFYIFEREIYIELRGAAYTVGESKLEFSREEMSNMFWLGIMPTNFH